MLCRRHHCLVSFFSLQRLIFPSSLVNVDWRRETIYCLSEYYSIVCLVLFASFPFARLIRVSLAIVHSQRNDVVTVRECASAS